MKIKLAYSLFICALILTMVTAPAMAKTLIIACAANFTSTAKQLQEHFSKENKISLELVSGSTGLLYSQIIQGAPFDLFFSADSAHPELLEKQYPGKFKNRFTYAWGKLALVGRTVPSQENRGEQLDDLLKRKDWSGSLALANPAIAPYGLAAKRYLERVRLLDKLAHKIIYSENVAQAFHFMITGNVDLAFVTYAQVLDYRQSKDNSHKPLNVQIIPPHLYPAIEQQAIQLSDSQEITKFMHFIQSEQGRKIIRLAGYRN